MNEVEVRIIVERPDKLNVGSFKEIYRNTLSYENESKIPFSTIYQDLKVLYPYPDAFIHFIIV